MSKSSDVSQSARKKSGRSLRIAAISVAVVAVVAIALVAASGAGLLAFPTRNAEDAAESTVTPPEVIEVVASTDRIVPGTDVQVACVVSHEEADTLTYQWTSSDGRLDGTGSEICWTAPDAEGLHRVFVTVLDLHGGADEASLALFVRNNTPPVIATISAEIDDDPGWVAPGATVDLFAEAADEEGDDLEYAWSATAGTIASHGPSALWTAPNATGMHWVTVDVTDYYGGAARRAIPISVSRGEPPIILGFDVKPLDTHQFERHEDGWLILGEKSCSISVLVDDQKGQYTYEWTADRGAISAAGDSAVWQAPPTGSATIVVRVINEMGSEASDSIRIGTWSFSCCG